MTSIPSVHELIGVKGATPMSTKTFNKHKGTLLPRLRERADPPPRLMRVGSKPLALYHENLRAEIALHGGTPVRGFKLFKFLVDKAVWSAPAWRAMTHVVVATVSPSGTTVYTDPNGHSEDKAEYIFVPSARAHRELTDEQLLSGDWHMGSVVGGPTAFCARYMMHERLHGRARSVIAYSPEELLAKPKVLVRLPPHFLEWHRLNEISSDTETLAEMMGATVFSCDEEPNASGEIDAIRALAAVSASTEACVDGVPGIKLELKCTEQMMRGELSVAEARRLFFSHFDSAYAAMRAEQTRRFHDWSESWGQLENKALDSFR